MKKMDVLIAVLVGLAASVAIIWYAEPEWVSKLRRTVIEWRTPKEPSHIDVMRDERRRQPNRRTVGGNSSTSSLPQRGEDTLAISVRDFATRAPLTDFRYRRMPQKAPPGLWENQGAWFQVSNDQGIFRIASARIYAPTSDVSADTIEENWKSEVLNSLHKAWSKSDTLEIRAEGYEDLSVGLYSLLDENRFDSDYVHPIYLNRIDENRARASEIGRLAGTEQTKEQHRRTADLTPSEDQRGPAKLRGSLQGAITIGGAHPLQGTVSVLGTSATKATDLTPEGTYRIEGLTPGLWFVRIRATTDGAIWLDDMEQIKVQRGDAAELNYDFAPTGSLAGMVTGLRADESGGVFAIKGEYSFSNVTDDDLYGFGDFADAEVRVAKDGTFSIRDLEQGRYTIVAISERFLPGQDHEFYYAYQEVDVTAGSQAEIALSLE